MRVCFGLFLCAISCLPAPAADPHRRVNVVQVIADDMGWCDIRAQGHPYIKTPSLDRLMREGTSFEQFYVGAPVCTPSRVTFMTGRFCNNLGIHGLAIPYEQGLIGSGVPVVTQIFKDAGYSTGHFGKWHIGGHKDEVGKVPDPSSYGVDEHITYCSSAPKEKQTLAVAHTHPDYKDLPKGAGRRDHVTINEGIKFIRKHRSSPFYLQLWSSIPHAPLKPSGEELAAYSDLKNPVPDAFASWMKTYAEKASDFESQLRAYMAAMTALDKEVGRLLDALDELKLTKNTLLVFTSDNGPESYWIGNMKNAGMGSPGPFRSRKRGLYEGGIRVPFIVRWPGKVEAGKVDRTTILSAADWLPTAAAAAGILLPKGIVLDGENMLDVLQGRTRKRSRPLLWYFARKPLHPNSLKKQMMEFRDPSLAIRLGTWKFLVNSDGTNPELYDMAKDPEERSNCAQQHAEKVTVLTRRLLQWHKALPHLDYSPPKKPKTARKERRHKSPETRNGL